MLRTLSCWLVCLSLTVNGVVRAGELEHNEGLTRGQKTLLLNAGGAAAITAYGFLQWDYGSEGFHLGSEGWFEREDKEGGADKLGHLWTTYALSHLLAAVYRSWEYTDTEANAYGALSALALQTLMEIGDGTSHRFGASYEDFIMNVAGAGTGYVLGKYPELARKIDIRIEYTPSSDSDWDIFTDYENQRYLLAIKADGFDQVTNPFLQYLELHVGYFTRGYEDFRLSGPDTRERTVYVGVGLNVSKLVQRFVDTPILDYVQVPYTSARLDHSLD